MIWFTFAFPFNNLNVSNKSTCNIRFSNQHTFLILLIFRYMKPKARLVVVCYIFVTNTISLTNSYTLFELPSNISYINNVKSYVTLRR